MRVFMWSTFAFALISLGMATVVYAQCKQDNSVKCCSIVSQQPNGTPYGSGYPPCVNCQDVIFSDPIIAHVTTPPSGWKPASIQALASQNCHYFKYRCNVAIGASPSCVQDTNNGGPEWKVACIPTQMVSPLVACP